MAISPDDVMKTINLLGEQGKRFQSRQVRKHLRVTPTDRNATSRVHNLLRSLERDGVVEVVPGNRKRNKYYRLSAGSQVAGSPTPPPTASPTAATLTPSGSTDRLTRMETLLASMDQRLAGLESQIGRLLELWR